MASLVNFYFYMFTTYNICNALVPATSIEWTEIKETIEKALKVSYERGCMNVTVGHEEIWLFWMYGN